MINRLRKCGRVSKPQHVGPKAHLKELSALLRDNARRHRLHRVFSDFCELAALAISNSVDKRQYEAREARYLQVVGAYEPDEVARFPHMLALLVHWLSRDFADCLGELFMSLELGDHYKGQFFTPYHVSALMAGLTVGDVREHVARQGFVTVSEPASGAGGMLIAVAEAIRDQGVNYQQVMHATAVDVDLTAVHMTYIQLALLHVPAVVVHGNTLALTEHGHWLTPAHVLGGWDRRLAQRSAVRAASEPLQLPTVSAKTINVFSAAVSRKARRAPTGERLGQKGLFACPASQVATQPTPGPSP